MPPPTHLMPPRRIPCGGVHPQTHEYDIFVKCVGQKHLRKFPFNKPHHVKVFLFKGILIIIYSRIQSEHKMDTETKVENIISKEEAAAQQEIWKFVFGFTPMAVVKCAIELGIPDIVENHPKHAG
ncbi:putative trans-resveratrol di-O-methyltransferase [Helianthus debilis subsp. tardiflorus]